MDPSTRTPATSAPSTSTEPETALLLDDTRFDAHAPRAYHPERPERLLAGLPAEMRHAGLVLLLCLAALPPVCVLTAQQTDPTFSARVALVRTDAEVVNASGVTVEGLTKEDFTIFDEGLEQLTIRGEMAVGMGLLLHEMATNAVKYGALSNSGGRVTIALEPVDEGRAVFRWREWGGPQIGPAAATGFGTRLLSQVLRPQGGEVKFDFDPTGFHARVEFPTVR